MKHEVDFSKDGLIEYTAKLTLSQYKELLKIADDMVTFGSDE